MATRPSGPRDVRTTNITDVTPRTLPGAVGRAHGASLRVGAIELRAVRVVTGESADVADDAHDGHPGSEGRQSNAAANRVGAGEDLVGERPVHDHDWRALRAVARL